MANSMALGSTSGAMAAHTKATGGKAKSTVLVGSTSLQTLKPDLDSGSVTKGTSSSMAYNQTAAQISKRFR